MSYRYDLHGNRDHLDEQDDAEKRSSRVSLRVYAKVKALLSTRKPTSPLFARMLKAGSPAMMLLVGIVFALSFETLSQASLFAMVATKYHGWQPALILASLFVLGMIITDGINGWFISKLIRRSDQTSRHESWPWLCPA